MSAKDIQMETTGFYKIPIQKVGVRNIKVPFTVATKSGKDLSTIATFSSYCDLSSELKGIHMSKISRSINEALEKEGTKGFDSLSKFAYILKNAHKTNNIWIKSKFDYIVEDKSPATNLLSYEPLKVEFDASLIGDDFKEYITIETVEMSLCPCSKEMSMLMNNLTESEKEEINNSNFSSSLMFKLHNAGFGAHNQKSYISIKVELMPDSPTMWIEDLMAIARSGSSCPAYSTLKRPDEKYVTETSFAGGYFNDDKEFVKVSNAGPKFVEDISRDIAAVLDAELDYRINDYVIVVRNDESIHSGDIEAVSVLHANRNLR